MRTPEFAPIVNSEADWMLEIGRFAENRGPSFFPIRAKLPRVGRTNQVLGASRQISVVLKTYASGGENELHAHTNEDHLFVVLNGAATFVGPKGETRDVKKNDCVLIPCGALYKFHAKEVEPLVLLRIGAAVDASKNILARVDDQGAAFGGYT